MAEQPSWIAVKGKLLLENYATPMLCALGVALYQAAALKWPLTFDWLRGIGFDPVAVNAGIIALMAALSNMITRRWSRPVISPPMTHKEAVAEIKASDAK